MINKNLNVSTDLIITSQGFGLLRKALIENIGVKRSNSFLFHFGRDLGVSRAEELKRHQLFRKLNLLERPSQSPKIQS